MTGSVGDCSTTDVASSMTGSVGDCSTAEINCSSTGAAISSSVIKLGASSTGIITSSYDLISSGSFVVSSSCIIWIDSSTTVADSSIDSSTREAASGTLTSSTIGAVSSTGVASCTGAILEPCFVGSAIHALAALLARLLAPTLLLTISWLNADLNSAFSRKEVSSNSSLSPSRLVNFLFSQFLKMTKFFFFFLSLVNL